MAAAEEGTGTTATFRRVYETLKAELLQDSAFDFNEDAVQWLDGMLDYNVLGGKLNRGLAVVESYKLLKAGSELSEDEVFLACILGWGIEWLQAYFLILDDIMDNSQTRRRKPCWYRVSKVGLIAINDGLILRSQISRIFKRYFYGKTYYVDLLDLFNEVEFKTTSGELLDLITTNEGKKDLSKYTTEKYATCKKNLFPVSAVHCAEWGIRSHLLLRGEQLDVPTGYNLISLMFGNVTYAARSVYAHRDEMLYEHAMKVAGTNGTVLWADDIVRKDLAVDKEIARENDSKRVVIVKEGAGTVQALLGVMRLVEHLSNLPSFQKDEEVHIVVDAGTGTTAVGLTLGAVCLGLHWRVTAVMLADTLEIYQEQEKSLISDFKGLCNEDCRDMIGADGLVHWVDRSSPRKFGKVVSGEIASCRNIAQQTGILLDPVYTLAAWEQAVDLCRGDGRGAKVAMIHTGGTLGLFGLAQRYPQHFAAANEQS